MYVGYKKHVQPTPEFSRQNANICNKITRISRNTECYPYFEKHNGFIGKNYKPNNLNS